MPPSTPASRAAVGGEVAAEQPQAAGRLERRSQRVDHLAVRRGRGQPGDLPGERLSGAGEAVAVQQAGVEQLPDDHRQAAVRIDVNHRITAERAGIHQHRKRARDPVEFLLRDHVAPEVETGGAGQFGRMEHDVGGTAHGDRHQGRVAQRRRGDDVTGPDAALGQHLQRVEQLGGELLQTATVLRRRAHHVQWLHAAGRDEGLHGVVGEHPAAAPVAR